MGYGDIVKLTSPKKIPTTSGEKVPGASVVLTLISNIATLETINDLASESGQLNKCHSTLPLVGFFVIINVERKKIFVP